VLCTRLTTSAMYQQAKLATVSQNVPFMPGPSVATTPVGAGRRVRVLADHRVDEPAAERREDRHARRDAVRASPRPPHHVASAARQCTAAMNADPKFEAEIVKIADEKAALKRERRHAGRPHRRVRQGPEERAPRDLRVRRDVDHRRGVS